MYLVAGAVETKLQETMVKTLTTSAFIWTMTLQHKEAGVPQVFSEILLTVWVEFDTWTHVQFQMVEDLL